MPLSVGEVYISRNLILCTTKWQMSLDTTKEKEKKKKLKKLISWPKPPLFPCLLVPGMASKSVVLVQAGGWFSCPLHWWETHFWLWLLQGDPFSPFEHTLKTSLLRLSVLIFMGCYFCTKLQSLFGFSGLNLIYSSILKGWIKQLQLPWNQSTWLGNVIFCFVLCKMKDWRVWTFFCHESSVACGSCHATQWFCTLV